MPPLLSIVILVVVAAILISVPLAWFYSQYWKVEVELIGWLAVYPPNLNQDPTENMLLLYPNEPTVLAVWIWLGPKVSSWTIRFETPRDCVVTDICNPSDMINTRNLSDGVFCYSKMKDSDREVFRITLQSKQGMIPPRRSSIRVSSRTNHDNYPSNSADCKELEMKTCDSIDAWVVGIS